MTIGAKRRKCFVYDALDFLKRVSKFFAEFFFFGRVFFHCTPFQSKLINKVAKFKSYRDAFCRGTKINCICRIFEKCKSELSSCPIKLNERPDFCKGNTLLSPNFHFQATFCQILGVINPFSFLMDHFVLLELDKAYHQVTSVL